MPQFQIAEQTTVGNIVVKRWLTPQLIELFENGNRIASHIWVDTNEDTTAKMAAKFASIVQRLSNPPAPVELPPAPSVVAIGYAEDRKFKLMDNGTIDVFNEDDQLIGTKEFRGSETVNALDLATNDFYRITGRPITPLQKRVQQRNEIEAMIAESGLGTSESEPIFASKGNAPEGGSFEDDQRLKNSRRRRVSKAALVAATA